LGALAWLGNLFPQLTRHILNHFAAIGKHKFKFIVPPQSIKLNFIKLKCHQKLNFIIIKLNLN
jgi:hypothetical protein